MRSPIDGGIVLITGASSGIGMEMAKLIAHRAKRLILVARRRDRLESLATELKTANKDLAVDVECCDLAGAEQTKELATRVLEKHGAIDVLINNAGFGDVGLFERRDVAKICQLINVNITALTILTRLLLPPMIANKKGGVLNVSSGYGLTWMPSVSVYCATKHYVTAFTESLRTELGGTGVVVSQLCPGPVPTEFDEIAETPIAIPSFVKTPPREVARAGISGFDRRRALVVPGILIRFFIFLGARAPRWMLRLMYSRARPIYLKRIAS